MTALKNNMADIVWKGPGSDIQVVSLNVQASISDLYLIQARIKTPDPGLAFEQLLHAEAQIVLKCGDDLTEDRIFSGIITRFSQGRTLHGDLKRAKPIYTYVVDIRPRMWLLTCQKRSLVFQKKTAQDIVSDVLSGLGVTFSWDLQGSPRKRDYCVQYGETDYKFVNRLLEDEGICFYFDQETGTVLFTNYPGGHQACRPKATLKYVEEISPRAQFGKQEFVSEFAYEETVTTGSFAHHHYNYETSQIGLLTEDEESNVPAFSAMEHYQHTHNYMDLSEGNSLVALRKEEAVSSSKIARGVSSGRSLDAGFCFTLTDHFRDALNKDWLLTSCQISAKQGNYQCRFSALPADVVFRPPRRTPRPMVNGLQTATVTGPDNAKVYLDDMGRCKLQFHWERNKAKNDRSSMWVRVGNNYAGKDYGIQWIPRVGHEVLVTFIDGNPDLPVVTGRVYNDFNTAPLTQAEKFQNIIKTIKDNHILFDDKDDAELVQIRAEKDMKTFVVNDKLTDVDHDMATDVANNESMKIGNNKSLSVGAGFSQTVGGKKTTDIKANYEVESEKGKIEMTADKGGLKFMSGSSLVEIKPNSILLKMGGNKVKIDASGITIKGTLVRIN